MKNKRIFKTLSALCAALVLMMGLSVTAFAQGTEELPAEDATNDSNVVVEETEDSPALTPDGNGFFEYRWYHPKNPQTMARKIAYVRHFAPFDWLIGTGDYVLEWEELQKKEAMQRLRALRFGSTGTIGLIDHHGRSLLSPSDASLEGLLPEPPPAPSRVTKSTPALDAMLRILIISWGS